MKVKFMMERTGEVRDGNDLLTWSMVLWQEGINYCSKIAVAPHSSQQEDCINDINIFQSLIGPDHLED